MLARVYSCAVIGLEGVIVEVEVDTSQGLPGMDIVGLPDAAVQESKQRVLAAIKNAGYPYPALPFDHQSWRPPSVRKEGPAYDLPIALGVLACMRNAARTIPLEEGLVVGELSLDGSVRHVRGVLPMAAAARAQGYKRIYVPKVDAGEAALIPDLEVIPVESLEELAAYLQGRREVSTPQPPTPITGDTRPWALDRFQAKSKDRSTSNALTGSGRGRRA